PRRAVGARLETRVAETALAALRHLQCLAGILQVTQLLAGLFIGDGGAHRHVDVEVFAAASGAVVARPAFTVARAVGALDAEIRKGVDAFVRAQPHAASHAAVAAIGAAEGDELLAP